MCISSVYVTVVEKSPQEGEKANRCPLVKGLEICIGSWGLHALWSVLVHIQCSEELARAVRNDTTVSKLGVICVRQSM